MQNEEEKIQFSYVVGGDPKYNVCRHAFKSLFGFKEGKLRKITTMKKSLTGTTPADKRGKCKCNYIIIRLEIFGIIIHNIYDK